MNNDLISREALKKAIDDYAEKRQDTLLWQSDIEEIIDNAPTVDCIEFNQAKELIKQAYQKGKDIRPQDKPIIKCKDCKYQVKEWRKDKRMKDKGYWVYGCDHFGEIMGYWGFGGNDNEFCSDAEQKGGKE